MSYIVCGSKPWLNSSRSAPIKQPGERKPVQIMRPQTEKQRNARLEASHVEQKPMQNNRQKIANELYSGHDFTERNQVEPNCVVFETMSVPMHLYPRKSTENFSNILKSTSDIHSLGIQNLSALRDRDILPQVTKDTENESFVGKLLSESENAPVLSNYSKYTQNDMIEYYDHNSNIMSFPRTTSRQSRRSLESSAQNINYRETSARKPISVRERFLEHDKNHASQFQRIAPEDNFKKRNETFDSARTVQTARNWNGSPGVGRTIAHQRSSVFKDRGQAAAQAWDAEGKSGEKKGNESDCAYYEQYEPIQAHGLIQLMPVGSKSLEDYSQLTSKNVPNQFKYVRKRPPSILHSRFLPIQSAVERNSNRLSRNGSARVFSGFAGRHQVKTANLRVVSSKRLFGTSAARQLLRDSESKVRYQPRFQLPVANRKTPVKSAATLMIIGNKHGYGVPYFRKGFSTDYREPRPERVGSSHRIDAKKINASSSLKFQVVRNSISDADSSDLVKNNSVASELNHLTEEEVVGPVSDSSNNNNVRIARLRKDVSATSSPTKSSSSSINGYQTQLSPLNVNGHHTQIQSPSREFRHSPKQPQSGPMSPIRIPVTSLNNGHTTPSRDIPQKVSLIPLTVNTDSPQPASQRSLRSNSGGSTPLVSELADRQSPISQVHSRTTDGQKTLGLNTGPKERNGIMRNTPSKILQGESVNQKENDIIEYNRVQSGKSEHRDRVGSHSDRRLNENIIPGLILNGGAEKSSVKIHNENESPKNNTGQMGRSVEQVDHVIKNHTNGGSLPSSTVDSTTGSNLNGTPAMNGTPDKNGSPLMNGTPTKLLNGHVSQLNGVSHPQVQSEDRVDCPTSESPSEKDGNYYLRLIQIEADRLNDLRSRAEKDLTTSLPEEACGRVRATVGKATLLTTKKFHQFQELCHKNLNPLEDDAFQTTCGDLAGFWDLILIQVQDVSRMFNEIETLRLNGWDESKILSVNDSTSTTAALVTKQKHSTELDSVSSPSAKSVSNGSHKTPAKSSAGPTPASKAHEEARRRLMAAKRAGRQRKASNEDEEIQIFTR